MLNNLPQDQAALIVERLGRAKVDELTVECPDSGTLYRRCIRAMGHEAGGQKLVRVPKPFAAWDEIHNQKEVGEPEFSHPAIAKTVKHFGGWSRMWLDFSYKKEEKARNTFIRKYEDITG